MRFKILIIFLCLIFSIIQSSFDFGIFNLNISLIFFIYILFFYGPNDALLMAFLGGLILDFFAINFGAYIFSFLLIFTALYYIEKELLPNDRFSTYVWMNLIGVVLLFILFPVFNILIKSLGWGMYNINFKKHLIMLLEGMFFNVIVASILYFFTNIFSRKTKNRFISIG